MKISERIEQMSWQKFYVLNCVWGFSIGAVTGILTADLPTAMTYGIWGAVTCVYAGLAYIVAGMIRK